MGLREGPAVTQPQVQESSTNGFQWRASTGNERMVHSGLLQELRSYEERSGCESPALRLLLRQPVSGVPALGRDGSESCQAARVGIRSGEASEEAQEGQAGCQ